MKKIIFPFVVILSVFDSFSQMNKVYTKSELDHITIFNQGANVERKGMVNLMEGANELIIQNVSPFLINESIQVAVFSSNVIINSVKKQMNFLGTSPETKEMSILKDSLFVLKKIIRKENINLEVFMQEKDLLNENKSVLKLSKEFIIDDLMDLASFFRERLLDVESNLSDVKFKLNKLNIEAQKIENQIKSIENLNKNQFSNIVVQLTVKENGIYNFEFSYNLNNAGWVPFYDIRSKEINSKIDLTYKAKVYQNSNESWKNVKLSLSTGDLNKSNVAPSFRTNNLSLSYPVVIKDEGINNSKNLPRQRSFSNDEGYKSQSSIEMSSSSAEFTSVNFGGTQIQYDIDLKYSIPSNKEPILIDIQKITIPATYDYYCYPKIDKDVFLMCHFKTINNQNFLPGNGQVFFRGKSVGRTYLDPLSVKSVLDLSLGRDPRIIVERRLIKKFSTEVKVGDKIKLERSYEINVNNNRKDSISLNLIDQIPVSNEKSISVELMEKSDANYEKQNGKLIWNLNLSPNNILKKTFKYSVKYPQDKYINGLN